MAGELAILERIQRKVLWLATWMVHTANARPNPDGTKVGGHQASSASVVSLLTALYFKALRPGDLVAVKAHAAPAFYAIQYLRGRLQRAALAELRSFGGLQAAFRRAGGTRLQQWLEAMPNAEYQRLLRLPPCAVRKTLVTSDGGKGDATLDRALSRLADDELAALVAYLGGHDLAAILDAFDAAEGERARPSVILAHTIKGWGLPR